MRLPPIFLLLLLLPGCLCPQSEAPRSLLDCRRLTTRAAAAMNRGDWRRAESLLSEAVETCGLDAETRRQYAEVLWRRGQAEQALMHFNEAVRLAEDDAATVVRRGELHFALGNMPAAVADAQQGLDLDPGLARAWLLRARIHQRNKLFRQALSDYVMVLDSQPHHREALWEIARLRWRLAELEKRQGNRPQLLAAQAALQSLLGDCPPGEEPQQALYLLGDVCMRLSRYDDAVEAFSLAAGRGRPTSPLLSRLAQAQVAAGRPRDAAVTLQHSLALSPEDAASQKLFQQVQAELSGQRAAGNWRR